MYISFNFKEIMKNNTNFLKYILKFKKNLFNAGCFLRENTKFVKPLVVKFSFL